MIGCLSLISGCKIFSNTKDAEPLSISFGTSGGFTGAVDEFILKNEGVLIKIIPYSHDSSHLKTLSKKETNAILKKVLSKPFQQIDLNQAGNLNQFIRIYTGNKITKTWQWTDGSEVPKELKRLFDTLMEHTK